MTEVSLNYSGGKFIKFACKYIFKTVKLGVDFVEIKKYKKYEKIARWPKGKTSLWQHNLHRNIWKMKQSVKRFA